MPGGAASGFSKGVYGVALRHDLHPTEDDFFKKNPTVAGMAAEDDTIIMNPYSPLTDIEKESVKLNEAARVHMRKGLISPPNFSLTPEQEKAFASYGKDSVDRTSTIAARLLSGDPSALAPTPEQIEYVQRLRKLMGVK